MSMSKETTADSPASRNIGPLVEDTMSVRMTYRDTDQMGFVYYANYLVYFEMARTELMRTFGRHYRECEAEGIFLPVVEASSAEALTWLRHNKIQILAASPHAEKNYTDVDLRAGTAIIVGAEQYGLSSLWMKEADLKVRIPMHWQAYSLNVATATTIMMFEAVRQRQREEAGRQTTDDR